MTQHEPDRLPDRGALVAWRYRDTVQHGTVENVTTSPDGTTTVLWVHRPGHRRGTHLAVYPKPAEDCVVVATVAQLATAAGVAMAEVGGRPAPAVPPPPPPTGPGRAGRPSGGGPAAGTEGRDAGTVDPVLVGTNATWCRGGVHGA